MQIEPCLYFRRLDWLGEMVGLPESFLSRSNSGGGVNMNFGTVSIASSIFQDNVADFFDGQGGGIRINSGTATLSKLKVTGNFAASGGGIYNGGTTTLTASTVTGNYTSGPLSGTNTVGI